MDEQLRKRFTELFERAERTGVPQSTKFLTAAEQSELISTRLPCALFGGYEGAERRVAVFGEGEPDVVCLRIAPVSRRFSDTLTHRDFLGSLMALGLSREVLGDIVVSDNEGYLFCLAGIADFISENLTEVKRTAVACTPGVLPDTVSEGGEEVDRKSVV